jgi:hypothetical protein
MVKPQNTIFEINKNQNQPPITSKEYSIEDNKNK